MKKVVSILSIFVLFISSSFCNRPKVEKSPYQVFFENITFENLKGNVLIDVSTRTFGCGTAAMDYSENLRKTGMDKFYEKYGYIYADKTILENTAKLNNIKLMWYGSGNEGVGFNFTDKKINSNKKLKAKLWKESQRISIVENPISMNLIEFTVDYWIKKNEESFHKVYTIEKVNEIWEFNATSETK